MHTWLLETGSWRSTYLSRKVLNASVGTAQPTTLFRSTIEVGALYGNIPDFSVKALKSLFSRPIDILDEAAGIAISCATLEARDNPIPNSLPS